MDDGMLIASELVTNAVVHSDCESSHRLEVARAILEPECLVISVRDPGVSGKNQRCVQITESPEDGGYRSLLRSLSAGGRRRSDGYRVWAEVTLSG